MRKRLWLILAGTTAVVLVAGLTAAAWTFSNSILLPQPYGLLPEFTIIDADADSVTLPLPPSARQFAATERVGSYSLLYEDSAGNLAYGDLGEVLSGDENGVRRAFTLLHGEAPQAGNPARLDTFMHRSDPQQAHGLAFTEVRLEGEVGGLRSWWLEADAERDTALLLLHGRRRADLTETLRLMPILAELGYSMLALAYRNHDQSADSPDGFFHYGSSEWRDALTGLEFLASQGYEQAVIVGLSMGGAVAIQTALRQHEADFPLELRGLILDSPLLDPRTVFYQGARNMGIPAPLIAPLTDMSLWVARLRSGIDWPALDMRDRAAELAMPILLIHGTADSTVPVELSDAFAASAPQYVRYQRPEGVEHVEAWNHDPAAYGEWLEDFLSQHAP